MSHVATSLLVDRTGVPPIEIKKDCSASKLASNLFIISAVRYLRPVISTVTFSRCQMSSTYSCIVLSDENLPT